MYVGFFVIKLMETLKMKGMRKQLGFIVMHNKVSFSRKQEKPRGK